MIENTQDEVVRTYTMLSSLRNNIAEMTDVKETYVNQFHILLARLENMGIHVSEFWIPDFAVKPRPVSTNTLTGETKYTKEKYIVKSIILAKLDAIFGYLEFITSERPTRTDFS